MKYKTGEAAALLDLTKEGLRYLTRKGGWFLGFEPGEKAADSGVLTHEIDE